MNIFTAFVKAARLRTLPLSLSGIIMGCGLAHFQPQYYKNGTSYFVAATDYSIFLLAILTTIALQVLSNFANDYGDGIKGTDAKRKGEQRLVASGILSASQMKKAILVTAGITLLLAIALIYTAFGSSSFGYSLLFLSLGILSIIAAIKYTVGKNAYGYFGFGDVFVFLFFGWLSVLGSYFLYTKQLHFYVFLPASSIGFLSVAVLNLNNMRDRIEDAKNNKNTLVVKLGSQRSKLYHYVLISMALISAVIYVALNYYTPKQYVFLIAFLPLINNMIVVGKNILHAELDAELKKVALSTFLFSILFVYFN